MLKLQLPLAARLEPQVLVCEKSPGFAPFNATLLIAIGRVEVLLSVTVWTALALPTVTFPKLKLVAESVRFTIPVPLSAAVCGLPDASSETLSVPAREPMAAGVNVTLMLHDFPAATVAPQLFVCAKSPLAVMPEIFSTVFWLLVSFTV